MSELNTPYYVGDGYFSDDGVEICDIEDCNGVYMLTCFMSDSKEIKDRLNKFEALRDESKQLKARIARLEDELKPYLNPTTWLIPADAQRKKTEQLLNESPQQSLADIQADAVEKAAKELSMLAHVSDGTVQMEYGICRSSSLIRYAGQLRNSVKDGEL